VAYETGETYLLCCYTVQLYQHQALVRNSSIPTWATTSLDELKAPQLVKKFMTLLEPKCSCSHEPAICLYPEQDESVLRVFLLVFENAF